MFDPVKPHLIDQAGDISPKPLKSLCKNNVQEAIYPSSSDEIWKWEVTGIA
jgi:hypothetical protein